MPHNNKSAVNERRQKLWTLLTKGMKGYEIARALDTDQSMVSRDIKFLTAQSQDYLNSLAKETLPFMYHASSGIAEKHMNSLSSILSFGEDNSMIMLP